MAFRPVYASSGEIVSYKYMASYSPELKIQEPALIKVPCGKCLGCRLDYSRTWADRMIYELDSNDGKGIFVTLTYDEQHVPPVFAADSNGEVCVDEEGQPILFGYTLVKKDLQNFFKRLRKYYAPRTIRYYACGEYGRAPKTGLFPRPHYHAIIYGLSLSDFDDLKFVKFNELGQPYYTSALFQSFWSIYHKKTDSYEPYGMVRLSEVSYKTCAYVSRYCSKKALSDFDLPDRLLPEFTLMSRDPGIGYYYLKQHPDFFDTKHKFFSDMNGQVQTGQPKYFLDKLKLTDPDRYASIVEERKRLASDNELLKLRQTSLSLEELNHLEEVSLLNKCKILFNRREEVNHAT